MEEPKRIKITKVPNLQEAFKFPQFEEALKPMRDMMQQVAAQAAIYAGAERMMDQLRKSLLASAPKFDFSKYYKG